MSRCNSCKHMMCPFPEDMCIELCDMYLADGPTRCKCVEQNFDEDEHEASNLTSECKGSPSEINNLHTVTLIGKANDSYDKACIICEDVKWG